MNLPYRLAIDKEKIDSGQTVLIRAGAWDKRDFSELGPGPQAPSRPTAIGP